MGNIAFYFAKAIVLDVKPGDVIYYNEQTPHEEVLRELPEVLRPLGLRPEAFAGGVKAVAL
jgi:hypothetical protein